MLFPSHAWCRKTLRVGVPQSYPPFSFIDKDYKILRGFSVDMAKLFIGSMGLGAEFYAMTDSRLLEALINGKIDLISGIMINQEYRNDINLIETTIQIERKFFVSHDCLTITCYKDLPGHILAFEQGRDITKYLHSLGKIRFLETKSQEEALALLDSGKAQVYISDCSISTLYIIQKNGFKNIKEVGMPIETVPLALAVYKGNTELLTSLSVAFGKTLENKSYDTIYKKWLGHNIQFYEWNRYLKYILAAVSLTVFILFGFIFWNRMLKRKVLHITRDLKRSEQKYRDLIESSPDMIHLISPLGEIRLANKIVLKHMGYNEKEIATFMLHDLVLPHQKEDMTNFVNEVFQNGYSNKEFTFKTRKGYKIHVEMVATMVKGSNGTEDLACCFSRDLSERKRLEEDLIHSDRLAIMGQMAAGLAHEINNPLGIILTNAEDIMNHELNTDDARESLKSIGRNALRAAKIIEDLLTFTRPNPPEIRPIDLIQLIDSSLLFFKQRLKQKKIKIQKFYPGDSILIHGDENLIQQLSINLILNAIQAIKYEGQITIRVGIKEKTGAKMVTFEVEDNGRGIPDKDLQKIFDPFFSSRKEKGFGLGLFTSRIIVEKHHGTLKVQSKEGEGTVMTVEFPFEPLGTFIPDDT
jgi:PAS domain S-box-containing protein